MSNKTVPAAFRFILIGMLWGAAIGVAALLRSVAEGDGSLIGLSRSGVVLTSVGIGATTGLWFWFLKDLRECGRTGEYVRWASATALGVVCVSGWRLLATSVAHLAIGVSLGVGAGLSFAFLRRWWRASGERE